MTGRSKREVWLLASLLLGVVPSLAGWSISYGASPVTLSSIAMCAGLISLAAILFWAVRARANGERPIFVGIGVAIWGLAVVGAFQLGTWLTYHLWNPAWSKPFMTDGYANSAGLIGIFLCAAAALLLVTRLRRTLANG